MLLLQVPVEQEWDVNEYLAHICYRAGLPPDSWLNPSAQLFRFQAQVFSEESPGGKVVEKKLG